MILVILFKIKQEKIYNTQILSIYEFRSDVIMYFYKSSKTSLSHEPRITRGNLHNDAQIDVDMADKAS